MITSGSCRRIERSRAREIEADLRPHLYLVDAGQLVFDRIFDGNDIALGRIELCQSGVERGRLAAAGRPGHQHHPVRQFERPFETRSDILGQTQFFVVEIDRGAVEHAQHDLLAVERGHRRYPEIDLVAAHRQLDAAILRQPALGDVEPRHDLDAGDHRGLQSRRRRLDLVQHPVVAIAHPQPVGKRLQMHVRGMGFDGASDHLVDEPDHRRLAGEIFEAFGILLGRLVIGHNLVQHRLAIAGLDRFGVEPVERAFELDRHGDGNRDRPAKGCRHRLACKDVERIDHREHRLLAVGNRQRVHLAQKFWPQPVDE